MRVYLLTLTGNSLRMACKAIRRGLWLLLTTALLASTLTQFAGKQSIDVSDTLHTNQFLLA
jgi:hypothetical protein